MKAKTKCKSGWHSKAVHINHGKRRRQKSYAKHRCGVHSPVRRRLFR